LKLKKDINRLEKKEAKEDGAQVVPNSGRGNAKGDARYPKYLIDYKFPAKTFTLSLQAWKKHAKDSWQENMRDPLIIIKFDDGTKLAVIEWELIADVIRD